ncbi:molecular chaperone DnaJ [Solibacillus sp. R5-41]|uniref:DnaJ domain-containing protein n=1 Tax=Solibacillus sp. R5-41 TaxID=2048654 RepID=UPI000C128758|nr:DnaJ domain-containing protein [Solibacillus sp. R5-41]ATP40161.1 molecular chaperone DnaJ [Solibacillus sp. R5-41]
MKNYYETLGISKNATQDQIKAAYRKLSKKHHPDVNGGSKESERIFLEGQEAYKVLKDAISRKDYDTRLEKAAQSKSNLDERTNGNSREQSTVKKQEFNMNNIEKNFEHFFGFNPKTKEMSTLNNQPKKKNPIDTTDLFERFFKK